MTNVKQCAERLLEKYHVNTPPVNAEYIAEKEGVDVVFVEFSGAASGAIHGFYDHDEGKIFVNSEDDSEEKLFTIAHELGHFLLHKEYAASEGYIPRLKTEVNNEQEREADEFAVRLLVPSRFGELYADVFDDSEMSKMFLVSKQVVRQARDTFV